MMTYVSKLRVPLESLQQQHAVAIDRIASVQRPVDGKRGGQVVSPDLAVVGLRDESETVQLDRMNR